MPPLTAWPVLIGLGLVVVALAFDLTRKSSPTLASYEAAIEAAKLLKDWGAWMTTVSTGVIASVGLMLSSPAAQLSCASPGGPIAVVTRNSTWAAITIALLLASILCAAWVLGSLPAMVLRLKKDWPSVHHDLYRLRLFSFLPFQLVHVAGLQHALFAFGLYCFAFFVTYASW